MMVKKCKKCGAKNVKLMAVAFREYICRDGCNNPKAKLIKE